jgi:O-antigen/teichoic acid export membrane protein
MILTVALNALNVLTQLLVLNRFDRKIMSWPMFGFFKERTTYSGYNFWYWLQSSIALIGFLTDKLAVAWFTDVKTLGYYYIGSMIGANIHNIFLSFGGFIFPRVSYRLAASGDLKPLYFVSRALIALPGWLLTLGLLLFGDPLFRLWLGNETYLNSIYFIKLYLIFEAGMMLIIVPFYFINGTQKIRLNSLFEVVIRLSHFTSMLLGYYFVGVNGIVYGLIVSTLLNIPFQYFYFHKEILNEAVSLQPLLVILPVIFLFAILVSKTLLLKVSLVILFTVICKLIYFDPGRKYTKDIFLPGKAGG